MYIRLLFLVFFRKKSRHHEETNSSPNLPTCLLDCSKITSQNWIYDCPIFLKKAKMTCFWTTQRFQARNAHFFCLKTHKKLKTLWQSKKPGFPKRGPKGKAWYYTYQHRNGKTLPVPKKWTPRSPDSLVTTFHGLWDTSLSKPS